MRNIGIFLLEMLILIYPQIILTSLTADQHFQLMFDKFGDDASSLQNTQPIIQINQNDGGLTFTAINPDMLKTELPIEYKIGAIIQIITSSELSKRLVIRDKNMKDRPIPLTLSHSDMGQFTYSALNKHYQIELPQLPGDYCFFQMPFGLPHSFTNDNKYCFRVLPTNLLALHERVIYIFNATNLSQFALRRSIQQKLNITTDDTPPQPEPSAPDLPEIEKTVPDLSEIEKSAAELPPQASAPPEEEKTAVELPEETPPEQAPQEQAPPEQAPQEETPPAEPIGDEDGRRRLSGTDQFHQHSPTIIGIYAAFETNGILIPEIELGKLLFLVQHIIDKIIPFLSSQDLIITLPVAYKLAQYERATVSERVALVVNNAKKIYPNLQLVYELQYLKNTETTFGGRIIFDIPSQTTNVPVKQIKIVPDYYISIHRKSNNGRGYKIYVQQPLPDLTKKQLLYVEINKFGYDHLFDISRTISHCILNAMGITNLNDITIDIANDGNNININKGKENDILIEFELELEGDECCVVELSDKSIEDRLYTNNNNNNNNNRQIIVIKANSIKIIQSKALLQSESVNIFDIVYKMDNIDEFNKYEFENSMDISSHSKMQCLHDLLYSSKENILIPKDLWYLCVTWTQLTPNNNGGQQQIQTTKCSENLYFTPNFLIQSNELKLANEFNSESIYSIDQLDSSGFLSLQLVHLQSLLQKITDMKSQMNQESQDEETLYHNLQAHKALSSPIKQHLKQMERMYQKQLNKIGEDETERNDFQNQLKIIQQQLRNEQAFEKEYGNGLHLFQQKEIHDPTKSLTDLMDQIRNSHQQIVKLESSMRQQKDMLHSLKEQIDSIEINVD